MSMAVEAAARDGHARFDQFLKGPAGTHGGDVSREDPDRQNGWSPLVREGRVGSVACLLDGSEEGRTNRAAESITAFVSPSSALLATAKQLVPGNIGLQSQISLVASPPIWMQDQCSPPSRGGVARPVIILCHLD